MSKIYGHGSQESFNRMRKAVRRVLGERQHGAQRRRQAPVMSDLPQLGKADANIAGLTSGTISLYKGAFGSETDTGNDVTAFNMTDQQADEGKWVEVVNTAHGIGFKPLECPA